MTTPYDLAVLADAPVSYWNLAETSGTIAADSADSNPGAYGAGCTPGGLPPFLGLAGSAAFAGTGTGAVTVPHAANLDITGNVTVECWARCADTAVREIVCKPFTSLANPYFDYCLSQGRTNGVAFFVSVGATYYQADQPAGLFALGPWLHVVGVYDGSHATCYVNGAAGTPVAVSGALRNDSQNLVVGGPGNWSGETFNGSASSVAVYNYALTASQVRAHYAARGPSPYAVRGPLGATPPAPVVAPAWRRGVLFALTPGREAGDPAGVRDALSGAKQPYLASPMTRASGPWGPELNSAHAVGAGVFIGRSLQGSAAFTLSSLCLCDQFADLAHLWGGENVSSADMRVSLYGTGGGLFFQLGADGAYPNLTSVMPLGEYVLVTCRLAPGGVRSIWLGPYKVAERTDAGIAYGSGFESNGSGWGGSPQNAGRAWGGRLTAGYAWARALSDAEIVALAADPFAPVRPAPVRLGALAPPSPSFGPVPWLRGPAAGARATRLPPAPASGWAPGLAAAADLLPWLGRVAEPAPPVPAPRALLAPWSPASAPAPDPLAWLLRRVPSSPPEAAPLTTPHAGWRPELAGGFAPAVRHALVRFWRGPQAHMPRLEDGEPAWATDTKSLWMGSASGNVRIGP